MNSYRGPDDLASEVCVDHVLRLNYDFTPRGKLVGEITFKKAEPIPEMNHQWRVKKLLTAEFAENGR